MFDLQISRFGKNSKILKVFFFQCHIAFILLMPTILIQNGGHKWYEDSVTLKEKNFLDKGFD